MRNAIRLVIFTITLTVVCYAQTGGKDGKPSKPDQDVPPTFQVTASSEAPTITTFSDSVTKDGHYRFVVDDSSDRWRCQVTSYFGLDYYPTPAAGAAVTIVCIYGHTPDKVKK